MRLLVTNCRKTPATAATATTFAGVNPATRKAWSVDVILFKISNVSPGVHRLVFVRNVPDSFNANGSL
jgi:hypothetical protein